MKKSNLLLSNYLWKRTAQFFRLHEKTFQFKSEYYAKQEAFFEDIFDDTHLLHRKREHL